MKSLNSKLLLSALGVALVAMPAVAHSARHRHVYNYAPRRHVHNYAAHRPVQNSAPQYGYTYTPQSGYSFTPQYIPGFGNVGYSGPYASDSCC
jgi:hypothetical protein